MPTDESQPAALHSEAMVVALRSVSPAGGAGATDDCHCDDCLQLSKKW